MPKPSFISQKLKPWIEARTRFNLSHAQIQMARELGMNPRLSVGARQGDAGGWRPDRGHLDRRLVPLRVPQGGRRLEVRPHRPHAQTLQRGRRAFLGDADPAVAAFVAPGATSAPS